MHRRALRMGAELVPVVLVVGCVASSLGLILHAHRRPPSPKRPAPHVIVTAPPVVAPTPVIVPPAPTPPAPDPTLKALADLRASEAEQRREAEKADRVAARNEAAAKGLATRADGWKRRGMMARAQLDRVDAAVQKLEDQADAMARARDVLAARREAAKADLARASGRSGVAILPYKGANGTWRLPIVIECADGSASLQPRGPSFSLVELSGVYSMRTSPIARAVALRLAELHGTRAPDGAEVVPYLLFIVRPDGIRPYYEARTRLEPLGITFGYELVEQTADIDFPDLRDLAEWSEAAPRHPSGAPSEFVWPVDRPGFAAGGNADDPIWPTQPTPGSGSYGNRPNGPAGRGGFPIGDMAGGERNRAPGGNRLPPSGGLGDLVEPPTRHGDGRIELTPDDLIAAAEEAISGGSRETPPADDGDASLIEPAPFPGTERMTGRDAGGVREGFGTPPQGRPGMSGLASRMSRSGVVPPRPSQGNGASAAHGSSAPTSGQASPPHAGQSRPSRPADASPGLVGMSFGESKGDGGDGQGEGGYSSEIYRKRRTLEMVVACGPQGLVVHPGAYHLSTAGLEANSGLLDQTLKGIVRRHETADPKSEWRPKLRFLVEPGGHESYARARKQSIAAGLDWPARLQIAEGSPLKVSVGGSTTR